MRCVIAGSFIVAVTAATSAAAPFQEVSPAAAAPATAATPSAVQADNVAAARAITAERKSEQRKMDTAAAVGNSAGEHYEVTLEGSTKDKRAVAAAAWTNSDASRTFELKGSTPLEEGTEEVEPLSFGGLPNGTTGSFTFQQFTWAEDGFDRRLKRRVCELALNKWPCDAKDLRDAKDIPIYYDLTAQFGAAPPATKADICAIVLASGGVCDPNTPNDLTKVNLHRAYLEFAGAHNDPRLLGLSGTVGRKKFDFLDTTTLEDLSSSHNNVEASAYLGSYSPNTGLLLLRGGYKRKWKAAQSKPDQVCRPIAGTTALKCKLVAIGAPKSGDFFIGSFEWRKFKTGGKLAVDPILSHDVKNNTTEIQVSVYFLPGEKGLTGGVRADWQAHWHHDPDKKKHTFTASVFVGVAALGILP